MKVEQDKPEESLEAVVNRLAKLTPLEFDQCRNDEAKTLSVRASTLDTAVAKVRCDVDGDQIDGSQADIAIALFAKSGAGLFHDDQDVAFAELPVSNHLEVWPVESKQFKKWLNRMFWNDQKKALREQPRKDAISTISGLAEIEGDEHPVHLRVAHHNGRHYIDLCDDQWSVIELDQSGWRVLDRSPVKFRRTSNMEALPTPIQDGDFTLFWSLVNVSKQDQPFILTWIIDALRANTQYPLLEIVGGHGTAKSTLHRFIRRIIDPNVIDLRGAPKTDSDIWVAARNNHCASFENLSSLAAKMQDVLCTVATGGGHAGRELYSNYDEAVTKASNPTIINGINPVVTASDLSDRTIRIHLPKIDGVHLREEHEIRTAFEDARQSIFSGMLDIFSQALGDIDNVLLKEKPRMVSYSILGEAVGKVLEWEDSFNRNYLAMRVSLLIEATQSSPAIMAIVSLIGDQGTFYGTYKNLLSKLDDDRYRSRGEGWPSSPRGLSGLITRHEPGLAAMGFKIAREVHGRSGNTIRIQHDEISVQNTDYLLPGNNIHNVHNVHGEGREHCEGEFPKENPPDSDDISNHASEYNSSSKRRLVI